MTTATLAPIQRSDSRLTHSEMITAQNCLRKNYLAYGLGIRPVIENQNLRFGAAFHAGLDLHKQRLMEGHELLTDGEILAAVLTNSNPEQVYDEAALRAMLGGYFWRWNQMDREIEWIASELQFEMPLINPETNRSSQTFTLAGKIDGIARLPSGHLAVVEHKTTSSDIDQESDYWRRLRIDSQISLYYLAARHLGYDVQTVLYDVTRKPRLEAKQVPVLDADGLKQVVDRTTGQRIENTNGTWKQSVYEANTQMLLTRPETPDELAERICQDLADRPDYYFSRREIPRLEADLEEYRYEVWQLAGLLRDCHRTGRWPRNTSACIGFGRCGYFDLCTSGYEINSGVLPEGYMVVDSIHQELE